MQEGRTSDTAMMSALMRAAHMVLDPPPWVLEDKLAKDLCGLPNGEAAAVMLADRRAELTKAWPQELVDLWLQSGRLSVVLRARYTEDAIASLMKQGCTQYVILGAGLDSFSYRRAYHLRNKNLQVFEVDHPATQAHKRQRLQELNIEVPSYLTFVPMDFKSDMLLDELGNMGYRPDVPALFSCLGLMQYLGDAALDRLLGQIASAAAGSEVVLDYLLPPSAVDEQGRQILRMVEELTASFGESTQTYSTREGLAQRLQILGLKCVEDLGDEEANQRYLHRHRGGLRFSPLMRLAKARVVARLS